jgi:hypothetical protein
MGVFHCKLTPGSNSTQTDLNFQRKRKALKIENSFQYFDNFQVTFKADLFKETGLLLQ